MAITPTKPNAFAHIEQTPITAALHRLSGHLAVSALSTVTVNYTVDPTVPQVAYSSTFAGLEIGSGTLNAKKLYVSFQGGVEGGFMAVVTLIADFTKNQVAYDIGVANPLFGQNYDGTLVSW